DAKHRKKLDHQSRGSWLSFLKGRRYRWRGVDGRQPPEPEQVLVLAGGLGDDSRGWVESRTRREGPCCGGRLKMSKEQEDFSELPYMDLMLAGLLGNFLKSLFYFS
ncbi:hypothetical protein XENOCAPTIV_003435, partial [Xenoophorus captivus]